MVPTICCRLVLLSCSERAAIGDAQLYDEYLEHGGPDGGPLPHAVKALALIQNKDKFCGLLNSLGEHSFAQDMDMTNRESVARKNEMKGARKFGTEDNQVLKGLERYTGGDKAKAKAEKDTKADDLEQTSRCGPPPKASGCADTICS